MLKKPMLKQLQFKTLNKHYTKRSAYTVISKKYAKACY